MSYERNSFGHTYCEACGHVRILKGCGCEACQPVNPVLRAGVTLLLCDLCVELPAETVVAAWRVQLAKSFARRVRV